MTGHKQTTDGVEYPTAYTYNLSGALMEETYPSTRKVKNVLNANGELSMVQSKKNSDSGYWSYANSFTNSAAGAVTSMQLGNGHWESTTFNSRLQPTQIALGIVQDGDGLLKLRRSAGLASFFFIFNPLSLIGQGQSREAPFLSWSGPDKRVFGWFRKRNCDGWRDNF